MRVSSHNPAKSCSSITTTDTWHTTPTGQPPAPAEVLGLGQFEHERLPIAARAVRQGRELGAYMLEQRGPKDEIETEHWREFHSTRGILEHTASSAFLYCNPS